MLFALAHQIIYAVPNRKAVYVYFTSKQILPFRFAEHYYIGTQVYNI